MRYTILNRIDQTSLFKKGLHQVLIYPGNELILGYGSLESSIVKQEKFLKAIIQGFPIGEGRITIIGSNHEDISKYIASIEKIKQYIDKESKSISIKLIVKKITDTGARQYHKKVAIKMDNGEPMIALIGSSNLSKNTYGEGENGYYTTEVDILFWNSFLVSKEEEKEILKGCEQEAKVNRFLDLRRVDEKYKEYFRSEGINLSVEFELEDIVEEVKNYEENGFYEVYNSEWMKTSFVKIYDNLVKDINQLMERLNASNYITKAFINKFKDFEDKVIMFSKTSRGEILQYIILEKNTYLAEGEHTECE